MTRPEDALAHARERAAAAKARGGYAHDVHGETLESPVAHTLETLLELAIFEPDLEHVRSTRRLGAPITMGKRLLVRTLDQYNRQILAQQQAFNVQLALAVAQLSERVDRLEERRG